MKIQIRLAKKWGEYSAGDDVLFDESKGREIIAGNIGVEVKKTMRDNSEIKKRKAGRKMKVKLLKPWGQFEKDAIVTFDESKGFEIIAGGFGVEVKKGKNIETASLNVKANADAKVKAKAKADAEAKTKAEAEAKAQAEAEKKADSKGKGKKKGG